MHMYRMFFNSERGTDTNLILVMLGKEKEEIMKS